MTGIYNDNNPASGQPPQVLAAWMRDQMGDLHEGPLRTLADLRGQLQALAFEWDATAMAQAVGNLRSTSRELHFDNLRPGWFARRMGKHKPVYARFVGAYERIVGAARNVKVEAAQLAGAFKGHAASVKRVMVGIDIESKALQAEVELGVTWLQDLCLQLNQQRELGSTESDLAVLAEAAQAFTQEYKSLQSVSSIAREIGVRMQGLLDRRNALAELIRGDMDKFDKGWSRIIGRVSGEMDAGRTSIPGLGEAAEAHEEFSSRLANAAEACSALQNEEHLMVQHLDMLRRELDPGR